MHINFQHLASYQHLCAYDSCDLRRFNREVFTEILKRDTLKDWYAIWPERFNNKTNGVTPRRWLRQCNPRLSALLDEVT